MPFFTTYPRCYVKRNPAENAANGYSDGDAELMVLWGLYMASNTDTTTWSYRKRILALAVRLFDNFEQWVEDQNRDPNVAGYNLDFLKDTLNYIETGQRRLDPLQWLELVNEVDEVSTVHAGQRLNVSPSKGLRSTSDTIQKWCSWPRGFEDLLLSLFMFFGGNREPAAPEAQERRSVGAAD